MCSLLPAHNPSVPFQSIIRCGIRVGTKLVITGRLSPRAKLFTIDLRCGALQLSGNIALHLSIRPRESVIVRNSLEDGMWGPEERHGGMPIEKLQPYNIEILTSSDRFTIYINGEHFCNFFHRISVQNISHLCIDGDTQIYFAGPMRELEGPDRNDLEPLRVDFHSNVLLLKEANFQKIEQDPVSGQTENLYALQRNIDSDTRCHRI